MLLLILPSNLTHTITPPIVDPLVYLNPNVSPSITDYPNNAKVMVPPLIVNYYDNVKAEVVPLVVSCIDYCIQFSNDVEFTSRDKLLIWVQDEANKLRFTIIISKSDNVGNCRKQFVIH